MFVKINGERHYLWRAVDHEGEILESYVTKKRNKSAALAFIKKALKRHGRAEKIVTDGLRSYPAAMRELGNLDCREMGRWKNNRAENSHLPFRRRERAMLRFRRMKTLQKFVSVHGTVRPTWHSHVSLARTSPCHANREPCRPVPSAGSVRVNSPTGACEVRWLGRSDAPPSQTRQSVPLL